MVVVSSFLCRAARVPATLRDVKTRNLSLSRIRSGKDCISGSRLRLIALVGLLVFAQTRGREELSTRKGQLGGGLVESSFRALSTMPLG